MTRNALPALVLSILLLGACAGDDGEDMDMDMDADTVATTTPAATPTVANEMGLLNPETASEQELMGMGLDSATVAAIVAARPIDTMLTVDDILEEHGMDEAAREALYANMFKPIDLNNATGEEMQLIPGVGDRMEHEFEEYRPWTDMAQFDREIGKYVDEAEVARLRKYVEIRSN